MMASDTFKLVKPERRRLSLREAQLVFAPYPVLWIVLGVFIDPAVFKFWVVGQSISPSNALMLGFVPIFFTITYLPSILIRFRFYRNVTWPAVLIYSLIAAFIGFILTPLP